MKTIRLNLKKRSYPIFIKEGLIQKSGNIIKKLNIGKDAIIITNNELKRISAKLNLSLKKNGFSSKIYTVPSTEKAKTIKFCFDLIDKISKYDKEKQVFLIALGGGVIGDLTGFVASIYKRGIPYVQIPTTLLAQIDSAIGGKTAIDLKIAKNLVGAFYQPRAVIVDPGLLKSLPLRQIKSGLAEVIKYAVIKDKTLFEFLEKNHKKVISLNRRSVEYIEERCISIKAKIVEKDEREKKGIRTILNFGHTIGHALESASGYQSYSHGEAISIGMICASKISYDLKLISKENINKIKTLIKLYKLPDQIKGISLNKIMYSMARDKKFIAVKNRFVLPLDIGKVIIRNNIPEEIIKSTILKYSGVK